MLGGHLGQLTAVRHFINERDLWGCSGESASRVSVLAVIMLLRLYTLKITRIGKCVSSLFSSRMLRKWSSGSLISYVYVNVSYIQRKEKTDTSLRIWSLSVCLCLCLSFCEPHKSLQTKNSGWAQLKAFLQGRVYYCRDQIKVTMRYGLLRKHRWGDDLMRGDTFFLGVSYDEG